MHELVDLLTLPIGLIGMFLWVRLCVAAMKARQALSPTEDE